MNANWKKRMGTKNSLDLNKRSGQQRSKTWNYSKAYEAYESSASNKGEKKVAHWRTHVHKNELAFRSSCMQTLKHWKNGRSLNGSHGRCEFQRNQRYENDEKAEEVSTSRWVFCVASLFVDNCNHDEAKPVSSLIWQIGSNVSTVKTPNNIWLFSTLNLYRRALVPLSCFAMLNITVKLTEKLDWFTWG